ncbi:MAG: hypothetical protein ACK41E_06825 [Deinococcales bacterium]
MIEGFLGAERFEIKVRLEQDKLLGRVGGTLMAREVKLELSATGLSGRVGGATGFDVRLTLEAGELVGFVGNLPISLRGVDVVTGTLGEGFSALEFTARQSGTKLIGSLGGLLGQPFQLELGEAPGWLLKRAAERLEHHDFQLELGEAPGWLGTLVVLVAFYALEKHKA